MIETKKATQPRQIVEMVAKYLKEGNLEGIVSMFHPECEICFPLDEPSKKGHEGARLAFKDFIDLKPTLISELIGEKIIGDTALLQSNWKIKDNEGVIMAEGTSTEVAKQLKNGSWVYFIDCPLGIPAPTH